MVTRPQGFQQNQLTKYQYGRKVRPIWIFCCLLKSVIRLINWCIWLKNAIMIELWIISVIVSRTSMVFLKVSYHYLILNSREEQSSKPILSKSKATCLFFQYYCCQCVGTVRCWIIHYDQIQASQLHCLTYVTFCFIIVSTQGVSQKSRF